jgi:hypothetical protein
MTRLGIRLALVIGLCLCLAVPAGTAPPPAAVSPVPVLAYYYIWFNPTSWNRAKSDYPLLGRYSSDEESVMRTHIRWAKAAGITGFIVSWKRTDVLSKRLQQLVRVADAEGFKLAIIYQGLDFDRRPQPAAKVAGDLTYFAKRYAGEPAFSLFGKPLVIWSGTWKYSRADVGSVTRPLRQRLLVLASEHNAHDYKRIVGLVDGDAYYWSSVNPETSDNHTAKLDEIAAVVHANRGLWIAPAAPGFDARKVGGTRVVDRKDGATFGRQFEAALGSSPDAIGLISWNEFSENSHVEPSRRYGRNALAVLADVNGARVPAAPDVDSSDPGSPEASSGVPLAAGLGGLVAIGLAMVAWRSRRRLERLP